MADLLELDDLKDYIGDPLPDDNDVLQVLLDDVEQLLEAETGQTFAAGGAVTDEPHDGTGDDVLYLDRPPTALTAAVKVGQDSASPDSTIATTDLIVDQAHNRIIYKNGYRFTRGRRNIFVSYTAADNLPDLAKAAVKEAVAFLYRRRGREHITADSLGEFGTVSMTNAQLRFLPLWSRALSLYRRWNFG